MHRGVTIMRLFLFALFLLFSLISCSQTGDTAQEIDMYNASGDMVGTATFTEQPDGVKIKLEVEGLTQGFHGIHIHEFPKCEGPDFASAGNHLNPEGEKHGLMHPEGHHLGDLPNIEADDSNYVEAELMAADATLLEGKKSLLRGEGTSLIIDTEQDDGVTQPSGNSGPRIMCGVLKADETKKSTESPSDPTDIHEKEEDSD